MGSSEEYPEGEVVRGLLTGLNNLTFKRIRIRHVEEVGKIEVHSSYRN
jgi:hypothetical protein